MTKASERQQRLRTRRKNDGSWRQLNIWVPTEVLEKLCALASASGKPQREVLQSLLGHQQQSRRSRKKPDDQAMDRQHQLTLFSDETK